jgi:hypothetical protein
VYSQVAVLTSDEDHVEEHDTHLLRLDGGRLARVVKWHSLAGLSGPSIFMPREIRSPPSLCQPERGRGRGHGHARRRSGRHPRPRPPRGPGPRTRSPPLGRSRTESEQGPRCTSEIEGVCTWFTTERSMPSNADLILLAEVWPRFGRGLAEVWPRFGRGLAEVWPRFR